jgi:hypothetical protein
LSHWTLSKEIQDESEPLEALIWPYGAQHVTSFPSSRCRRGASRSFLAIIVLGVAILASITATSVNPQ